MQIAAISALGTTCIPAAAASASSPVAMASTSGTMMSGRTSSNNARSCAASAISSTRASCATCWAGAPAYESAAHTHAPSRISSITTSLPNSPAPRNSTRVARLPSGVPSGWSVPFPALGTGTAAVDWLADWSIVLCVILTVCHRPAMSWRQRRAAIE